MGSNGVDPAQESWNVSFSGQSPKAIIRWACSRKKLDGVASVLFHRLRRYKRGHKCKLQAGLLGPITLGFQQAADLLSEDRPHPLSPVELGV
jgi:hypothetical protein